MINLRSYIIDHIITSAIYTASTSKLFNLLKAQVFFNLTLNSFDFQKGHLVRVCNLVSKKLKKRINKEIQRKNKSIIIWKRKLIMRYQNNRKYLKH